MHKSVILLQVLVVLGTLLPFLAAVRFDRNAYQVDVLSVTTSIPVPVVQRTSTNSIQQQQQPQQQQQLDSSKTLPHNEPKFREILSLDMLKSELKLQLPELNVHSNPFGCQAIVEPTCSKQQDQEESSEERQCTLDDELKAKAREIILRAEQSDAERIALHKKAECIHKTVEEHFRQLSNIDYIASVFRDKYKDLLHQRQLVEIALHNSRLDLKDLDDKDKAEIRDMMMADEQSAAQIASIQMAIEAASSRDHKHLRTRAQLNAEKLKEESLADALKLQKEIEEQKVKDKAMAALAPPKTESSESSATPLPLPQVPNPSPLTITDGVKAKEIPPTQTSSSQSDLGDVKIVSQLSPRPSSSGGSAKSESSGPTPTRVVIQIAGQGSVTKSN